MNLATELKTVTDHVRQQIPAEVLVQMEAATTELVTSGLMEQALKPGQRMPEFELPDATGRRIRSADLLAQGALLISFYRGNWCPYCNLELQALQKQLAEIKALGASLIAISPELPDQSLTTQEKHDLKFPVLSDVGNLVARQFGLVFQLKAELQPIYKSFGIDLEAHNGDRSFELPVPATYLVAQDETVLEAFVSVDYRERLAPETAISWLEHQRK
jgi:peroxiredoxin